MSNFKDFVGINICIYDPILEDSGAIGGNTFGYDPKSSLFYTDSYGVGNVSPLTQHQPAKTLVLLNLHRNGPFGYPTWKQVRASQNHLVRALNKRNLFTYVQEPGVIIGDRQAKYGDIVQLKEPVVAENMPVSLIGEVAVYNDSLGIFENKPVEIKTSFNNETHFFANDKANQYFNTILETDENYEALKEMYLDGGLEDEGSLLDAFSLLTYRQTVWPKQQYAYLDTTRSRKYYVNTFWRNDREDREENDVDNGFGPTIPSQSMWPLDAAKDFATRTAPVKTTVQVTQSLIPPVQYSAYDVGHRVGGASSSLGTIQNNSIGGEGLLQNSYSQIFNGLYGSSSGTPFIHGDLNINSTLDDADFILSASVYYSRRHTIKSVLSNFNPSFPNFNTGSLGIRYRGHLEGADLSLLTLDGSASLMLTSSLFEGMANWDAPAQAGKTPFYDSYEDYAQEIRNKGKGYSVVPEFRISSHVETYVKKGVTQELEEIFELSGALSQNTTTKNEDTFYKVISNSDFMKHFDLVKKDHEGFAGEKILTLKCKGLKKFLPYEGFYPAQRTVQLGKQFYESNKNYITSIEERREATPVTGGLTVMPIMEPLFAPGVLFNTIKSGVAVDFPIFTPQDYPIVVSSSNNNNDGFWEPAVGGEGKMDPEGPYQNYYWSGANRNQTFGDLLSAYSTRIPFEALVEPESYISNLEMILQEPHPFGLPYTGSNPLKLRSKWSGTGDPLYKKMANNILAEIPEFFISDGSMKTLTSLEEQDPNFGNAEAGNYYTMRIKMARSRIEDNVSIGGYYGELVNPPQDVMTYQDRNSASTLTGSADAIKARFSTKESLTMYSRPSAFGPPTWGGNGFGEYRGIKFRECGSWWGTNYPYTAPYYHGEAWCDLIFYANETKKYTLDEIMSASAEFPYYTRFWWNGTMDAVRDLTGYSGSSFNGAYENYLNGPWHNMIREGGSTIETYQSAVASEASWGENNPGSGGSTSGTRGNPANSILKWLFTPTPNSSNPQTNYLIQHPFWLNYNAMQLDSSINLFGKGTVRKIFDKETGESSEVASADTIRGKTRWIIQPKFETPILNFKKYQNMTENGGTMPLYAAESVPRGMWHQYGEIPEDPKVGVFLQVEDIPRTWLKGALGITGVQTNIKSMADLLGFSKEPVRLGEVASQKEISECVVAVPFVEKDGTRKFFSIPRADIDSCIESSKREIAGQFIAGQPPKAGDTVYEMVKKMQKYVFPPSMDFVKYEEIDPFAMYIFEFKHNLSKQDLADIWQNLPPEIGTRMEEVEASISHELLAAELLGGGAVVKNGVLDENAEGEGIPSDIQWMVFKVKKRAKTNYFDKVVAKKGTTQETEGIRLEGVTSAVAGKRDKDITYNWPYDFFSLVELVKIDAEVSFANIENDDKGQKSIKKVESKKTRDPSQINKARGKGRIE